MKIMITGTSQGIGKAIAELFLQEGHIVIGIDRQNKSIDAANYTHYVCDVRDKENLPEINDVEILINNAEHRMKMILTSISRRSYISPKSTVCSRTLNQY